MNMITELDLLMGDLTALIVRHGCLDSDPRSWALMGALRMVVQAIDESQTEVRAAALERAKGRHQGEIEYPCEGR